MARNQWKLVVAAAACLIVSRGACDAAEALLFAHRGGAHEFDENTIAAFKAAYDAGLRGFETDVRMTKDGQLVILHDDSLERTHHDTGPVERREAATLREVVTKKTGQRMLFLEELLGFFAKKPGVYLELEMKTSNRDLYPDARIAAYCKALHEAAMADKPAESDYVFTSADERPLREMKEIDPNADLLLIIKGPCSAEAIQRARQIGAGRIGVRMAETTRSAVRQAQEAGLRVSGWPGHTIADYQLGLGLGLNAVCSDIPLEMKRWRDDWR